MNERRNITFYLESPRGYKEQTSRILIGYSDEDIDDELESWSREIACFNNLERYKIWWKIA